MPNLNPPIPFSQQRTSVFIRNFCENPAESLHPLAAAKYYDTPAKQLLFDFIQDFLQVKIIGFQNGYGPIPDHILFNDPVYHTTIAIPCSVMLEPMERAREIVRERIREKHRAFEAAHLPELDEVFAYA